MSDDTNPIQQFILLTARKKIAEAELKRIQEELDSVEDTIKDEFRASGTQSVKQNGYTVYLRRDLTVTNTDTAMTAEVCKHLGHDEMLTVNHQRLKAWLKEQLSDPATGEWEIHRVKNLPPELSACLALDERYALGCRKA